MLGKKFFFHGTKMHSRYYFPLVAEKSQDRGERADAADVVLQTPESHEGYFYCSSDGRHVRQAFSGKGKFYESSELENILTELIREKVFQTNSCYLTDRTYSNSAKYDGNCV